MLAILLFAIPASSLRASHNAYGPRRIAGALNAHPGSVDAFTGHALEKATSAADAFTVRRVGYANPVSAPTAPAPARPHAASAPGFSSRRSNLVDTLTAPLAALGAKGVVEIARHLERRRPGDEVVLDAVAGHIRSFFTEDSLLTTAAAVDINARIKTAVSVDTKLRRKGTAPRKRGASSLTGDIDADVRDIAGLRVVVKPPAGATSDAEAELCYRVLRRLSTSPHVAEVSHVKDYVRSPKRNGYQSLHATILPVYPSLPRFEVQIRTEAMDANALHGSASHRLYKRAQART